MYHGASDLGASLETVIYVLGIPKIMAYIYRKSCRKIAIIAVVLATAAILTAVGLSP